MAAQGMGKTFQTSTARARRGFLRALMGCWKPRRRCRRMTTKPPARQRGRTACTTARRGSRGWSASRWSKRITRTTPRRTPRSRWERCIARPAPSRRSSPRLSRWHSSPASTAPRRASTTPSRAPPQGWTPKSTPPRSRRSREACRRRRTRAQRLLGAGWGCKASRRRHKQWAHRNSSTSMFCLRGWPRCLRPPRPRCTWPNSSGTTRRCSGWWARCARRRARAVPTNPRTNPCDAVTSCPFPGSCRYLFES